LPGRPHEEGIVEWTDRLANALGVEAPSTEDERRLLEAARAVAHRVERRATPVAAFLVGSAVGRSTGEREAALASALATLASLLPAPGPEP
jgi:hypothetical protein